MRLASKISHARAPRAVLRGRIFVFAFGSCLYYHDAYVFRHLDPLTDAGIRRMSKASIVIYDWCNVIMKEFELHKKIQNNK